MVLTQRIQSAIRDVPDFPKPGILFKDITPILQDAVLCQDIVEELTTTYKSMDVDAIAGIESRGFLFGLPIAMALGIPFILIRKKGKLPYKTISYKYDLEYGSAEIEMHEDAVRPNQKVMIHDDLLATGGTAHAAAQLITSAGAQVSGFSFLVELAFLAGKSRLAKAEKPVLSLVEYA